VENLEKYGVLKVDPVSDNQRTFILYLPFDEETMAKAEYQKPEKPSRKTPLRSRLMKKGQKKELKKPS
jgi:hypothetical protein